MSAANKTMTRKKVQRNRVYTICGYVIIASISLIAILKLLLNIDHLVGNVGTVFFFETTALLAFGTAWLIKGETFLKVSLFPVLRHPNSKACPTREFVPEL
jgi:hypothetical protein